MQAGPIQRQFGTGPGLVPPGVNALYFTATLAEVNAGKVVLPPTQDASQIRVLGIFLSFAGTWAAGTLFRLINTAATPVVVAHVAVANMNDNKWDETSAETVLGAGWAALLGGGQGLKVDKTGSTMTGGTSMTGIVLYQRVSNN